MSSLNLKDVYRMADLIMAADQKYPLRDCVERYGREYAPVFFSVDKAHETPGQAERRHYQTKHAYLFNQTCNIEKDTPLNETAANPAADLTRALASTLAQLSQVYNALAPTRKKTKGYELTAVADYNRVTLTHAFVGNPEDSEGTILAANGPSDTLYAEAERIKKQLAVDTKAALEKALASYKLAIAAASAKLPTV